jgi:hypothetical protein
VPPPPPPTPNPKYGVVIHTNTTSDNEYFLDTLGVDWFLDYRTELNNVPEGKHKIAYVDMPRDRALWDSGDLVNIATAGDALIAHWGFTHPETIRSIASDNPGTHWYLFGETNRRGYMHGDRFAPVFKYFAELIRDSDESAVIISPSILNWDYTCVGCDHLVPCNFSFGTFSLSGYQCGMDWVKAFVAEYMRIDNGSKPPVDIWAIDVYPLDWQNTPNSIMHAQTAIDQLKGMRNYLNDNGYPNTPIWITEIAVHVGFPLKWDASQGKYVRNGAYDSAKMAEYLVTVLDWLEANSETYNIKKWFFFITWWNLVNISDDDPYMGITFFDGKDQGASLNCLGRIYRAYSMSETVVNDC